MGNVHMEATQINYRGGSVKKSVEEAIKDAIELTPEQKTNINKIPAIEAAVATKAAQSIIAPEFDSEAGVYAIGDLVMHEGKLYEFTTAHETPGEWDSTEVSEKTVADEVDSLKSGLTDVNSNLTTLQSAINGKIVEKIESGAETDYAYLERVPGRCYIICVNTQGSNGINGYAPLVGVLRMGYQGQNFSYTPILTSDTYDIDITWDSTESKYKIQEIVTATSEAGINLVGFAVGVNPWV